MNLPKLDLDILVKISRHFGFTLNHRLKVKPKCELGKIHSVNGNNKLSDSLVAEAKQMLSSQRDLRTTERGWALRNMVKGSRM